MATTPIYQRLCEELGWSPSSDLIRDWHRFQTHPLDYDRDLRPRLWQKIFASRDN